MSRHQRLAAVLKLGWLTQFGVAKTRRFLTQIAAAEISLEEVGKLHAKQLMKLGMSSEHASEFRDNNVDRMASSLDDRGVDVVTLADNPTLHRLQSQRVHPWYFSFGNADLLTAITLGFSGSRDAGPVAIAATHSIASSAVARGWTVVSGGARGVDAAAHSAAMECGGGTVVLIAQGIATYPLPSEPTENLLILSEFLPGANWTSACAMQRNRSIVNLSDRLIIPQAGMKGGTMNAAEYALKTKHPTWVLDIGPEYEGNQLLARKGAKLLQWDDSSDILSSLEISDPNPVPKQGSLL